MPFTEDFLRNGASGDHFGMTQNAGMGWNLVELLRKQFVILSTAGGLRQDDDGVYRNVGPARVFRSERDAIVETPEVGRAALGRK